MSVLFNLLDLAKQAVQQELQKSAVVGPGGGQPPMDPAMAAGGAMPPGAMPPMDPAMMGGAPPMDPAMMGAPAMGMPAPPPPATEPAPPADPAAAAPAGEGSKKVKIDEWMVKHDQRLYAMQQQINAIMNAVGARISNESAVLPPGPELPVPADEVPTNVPAVAEDPGMSQPVPAGDTAKTASQLFGEQLTIDNWMAQRGFNAADAAAMTRALLGTGNN